jgi:hypothetical protein
MSKCPVHAVMSLVQTVAWVATIVLLHFYPGSTGQQPTDQQLVPTHKAEASVPEHVPCLCTNLVLLQQLCTTAVHPAAPQWRLQPPAVP